MNAKISRQAQARLNAAGVTGEIFETEKGVQYDISETWRLILENPKRWPLQKLSLHKQYVNAVIARREIDPERVEALSEEEMRMPIINAMTPPSEESGGLPVGFCIDGTHRIARAVRDGKDFIVSYIIPDEEVPRVKKCGIKMAWGKDKGGTYMDDVLQHPVTKEWHVMFNDHLDCETFKDKIGAMMYLNALQAGVRKPQPIHKIEL